MTSMQACQQHPYADKKKCVIDTFLAYFLPGPAKIELELPLLLAAMPKILLTKLEIKKKVECYAAFCFMNSYHILVNSNYEFT